MIVAHSWKFGCLALEDVTMLSTIAQYFYVKLYKNSPWFASKVSKIVKTVVNFLVQETYIFIIFMNISLFVNVLNTQL